MDLKEKAEILLSVIIPGYNASSFLCESIESVERQKVDSFEILIGDDGSTDKSFDVCQCHSRRWKDVRVFHKVNRGVRYARAYWMGRVYREKDLFYKYKIGAF